MKKVKKLKIRISKISGEGLRAKGERKIWQLKR
jgi:hypothetical protein